MHDVLAMDRGRIAAELFAGFDDASGGTDRSNVNVELYADGPIHKAGRRAFACIVLNEQNLYRENRYLQLSDPSNPLNQNAPTISF